MADPDSIQTYVSDGWNRVKINDNIGFKKFADFTYEISRHAKVLGKLNTYLILYS